MSLLQRGCGKDLGRKGKHNDGGGRGGGGLGFTYVMWGA